MTLRLYELTDQYRVLQQAIDNEEVEEEAFQESLSQLKAEFGDKVGNIGKLVLSLNATMEAVKSEEERLRSKRQVLEHKADWLRAYLLNEMTAAGIDKVKQDVVAISVRVNPPSVNILNLEAIPQQFRRVIPETWQPAKKEIVDYWKDTGKICAGVEIISSKKSIIIK